MSPPHSQGKEQEDDRMVTHTDEWVSECQAMQKNRGGLTSLPCLTRVRTNTGVRGLRVALLPACTALCHAQPHGSPGVMVEVQIKSRHKRWSRWDIAAAYREAL